MPSEANLRAACEVVQSRANLIRAPQRNTAAYGKKATSIRAAVSRHEGASLASVSRLVRELENPRQDVPRSRGRPQKLTDEEDEAIVAFIIWMERSGFPASKHEIEDAANTLLLRRDPTASPVSKMWYPRFVQDHPELRKSFLKAVEKSRESWEAGGITDLKEFFEQLTEAIRKYRINASECWNEDQCGIRVGCLRDRIQCLVVRTRRQTRIETFDPSNRESCTVIGTGSAAGDTIPPWIIFKAFPTLDFAYIDADPQMRFAKSETAFSNSEITFEWAQHFNRHSWAKSATAQSRGVTLEEWFGCDEFLRDPIQKHIRYNEPPISHDEVDGIWRLLLLDGFTGHGAFAFREYCIKFNIIVAPLPPHSTHILQPMDVGVFQPLKNAHQKSLRKSLRKGKLSYSRYDFTSSFQEVFDTGFTAHNIISGFEKFSIFPPNPEPSIAYVLEKQVKTRKAVDPAFSSLLPSESRFQRASDTAKHVAEKYHDLLSSPTRSGLRQVGKIVTEAVLLESTVTMYVDDRRARIEKRYHEKKRGKRGKPQGDFSHNISLQELREQQEEFIAETREKETKAQIRSARTILRREMENFRVEWRANKEVIVNGVTKKLQFKKWLEHTGKDKEYLSMDTRRSEMTELLSQKTDGFMIDTQLPPEVKESIRKANFASKPLNAMDWTALASSDDAVTFDLGQPPTDDGSEEDDYDDLDLIDLTQATEIPRWMRSSPPVMPSSSPSPEPASTPCPSQPQHHISRYKRIQEIIKEGRVAQEASQEGSYDADTAGIT